MKTITAKELRANINKLLDEVLSSGVPIEIDKGGQLLRISAVKKANKLDRLVSRPDVINGDPDDLADLHWV